MLPDILSISPSASGFRRGFASLGGVVSLDSKARKDAQNKERYKSLPFLQGMIPPSQCRALSGI